MLYGPSLSLVRRLPAGTSPAQLGDMYPTCTLLHVKGFPLRARRRYPLHLTGSYAAESTSYYKRCNNCRAHMKCMSRHVLADAG